MPELFVIVFKHVELAWRPPRLILFCEFVASMIGQDQSRIFLVVPDQTKSICQLNLFATPYAKKINFIAYTLLDI